MRSTKTFSFTTIFNGFYIGDLCYALPASVYNGDWGANHDYEIGSYEVDGSHYAMVYTMYGDGSYGDFVTLAEFAVDSGTIGICDLALATKGTIDDYNDLGLVFDDPALTGKEVKVTIEYDASDGVISIDIMDTKTLMSVFRSEIHTDPSEDEPEDEE